MKDVPTGTNERPSPCTKPTAASLVLGLDSQPGLLITLFFLFVLACLGMWRGFGEKRDTNTTDWQLLPSATNLTMRLLRAERSEKLLSAEKERDTSWVLL